MILLYNRITFLLNSKRNALIVLKWFIHFVYCHNVTVFPNTIFIELNMNDKYTVLLPLIGSQHGWYQDPNNCSRCKWPDGLCGIFCDKLAPPEIGYILKMSYNINLLLMWADHYIVINITSTAVCGGESTLSSTPLYIESPGYKQGPYCNHITCSWKIKVSYALPTY